MIRRNRQSNFMNFKINLGILVGIGGSSATDFMRVEEDFMSIKWVQKSMLMSSRDSFRAIIKMEPTYENALNVLVNPEHVRYRFSALNLIWTDPTMRGRIPIKVLQKIRNEDKSETGQTLVAQLIFFKSKAKGMPLMLARLGDTSVGYRSKVEVAGLLADSAILTGFPYVREALEKGPRPEGYIASIVAWKFLPYDGKKFGPNKTDIVDVSSAIAKADTAVQKYFKSFRKHNSGQDSTAENISPNRNLPPYRNVPPYGN
jgi:hypothetical protein